MISSRNATRVDFEHVIFCIEKRLIKPTTFITHQVQFDEIKDNFYSWLNPATGVIKAMVSF